MGIIRSLRSALAVTLRRNRFEDGVSEELQFHIDAYADDLVQQGMTRDAALRQARVEFGGTEGLKEELRSARGQRLFDELRQDTRYALRRLARPRAAVVITVLALGVGVNIAVFGVVHATLLRPLPHPNADRLVAISSRNLENGREHLMAPLDFFDIEARASSLAHVAAYYPPGFTLTGGDQAERVNGARASSGIFAVFGVQPALGRGFLSSEDHAGAPAVAIISHELWTRRFQGDASAIGKTIDLSGRPYTLVGVLPQGFHSPAMWPRMPDVWVPLGLDANVGRRDARMLRVLGRLRDGVSVDQARAELDAVASALATEHPDTNRSTGATVTGLLEQLTREARPSLYALAAAVLALLLVACANAGGVLVGESLERRHEFATRLSLGASRSRIVRQIVAENALLGAIAAAVGFLLAIWARDFIAAAAAASGIPRAADVHVGATAFAVGALLSLACVTTCALLVAYDTTRTRDLDILRTSRGATPRRMRARAALIAVEAALSLALLAGGALLMRSFYALQSTHPGFDPSQVQTTRISAPGARYPAGPALAALYDRVVERVAALPGVERVSVVDWLPLSGFGASVGFRVPEAQDSSSALAELRVVGIDYFQTLGVPVLAGRSFDRRDVEGAPPVIAINQALARAHFGSSNPVGRRITIERDSPRDVEIIAVVGDVRDLALRIPAGPGIYAPKTQTPWLRHETRDLLVRSNIDTAVLAPAIAAVVRDVEPDIPRTPLQRMDEVIGGALVRPRFYAAAVGSFSLIAVVLAAFGIFGAVTSAVADRRRELGVRLALGASPTDVLSRAASYGAGPTLVGLAVGIPLSMVGGRILSQQLYGVGPADVGTLLVAVAFMAAVTITAAVVPAMRAMRIDPAAVLKHENGG